MDISIEEIKLINELSKPIIQPIISTLIKPQIERLNKWIFKKDREQKVEDNFWENKFTKYLEEIYKDSSFLTTLVFPNTGTKIKDLYVPLTLVQSSNYEHFKIDKFDYKIFEKFPKIVVSDYAGMGKSTLLKWITLSIIEQQKSIPILVELRKINDSNSLLDEVFNQLNPIGDAFDKELTYQLLDLGFFTILLDGFDEIPYDIQDVITNQISDFIKKTGENNFIITSRPESALSTFSDFQLFFIKPLDEKEAFELIKKLDNLSKVSLSENLISEIREKNTQVKEFLTNPFLVSLLYKSYTYNKDIPSKKITFYEEVYSCLFKHHDLSKEGFKRPKRSKLDIFDFEIILRFIAFETSKIGQVIYTKDELMNFIVQSKAKNERIDFKEQNFYDDLTTTVPLFNIEGLRIKWAHKSIQDFFSAKYISNHTKKEEIIQLIFESKKHHYLNIIDLMYELEPKIFRKKIVKPVLEAFTSFYDSQFKEKNDLLQELIDERIALMFGTKFCFIKSKREFGFENARKLFIEAVGADENYKVGTTFHHSSPPYFSMNEASFIKQLLKIFRMKNLDLFLPKNTSTDGIDGHIRDLKFEIPYIIDDDLTRPFNNPKNFPRYNVSMNDRLRERDMNFDYNLDYQKSKIQLELIKKEILVDESENLFANI